MVLAPLCQPPDGAGSRQVGETLAVGTTLLTQQTPGDLRKDHHHQRVPGRLGATTEVPMARADGSLAPARFQLTGNCAATDSREADSRAFPNGGAS